MKFPWLFCSLVTLIISIIFKYESSSLKPQIDDDQAWKYALEKKTRCLFLLFITLVITSSSFSGHSAASGSSGLEQKKKRERRMEYLECYALEWWGWHHSAYSFFSWMYDGPEISPSLLWILLSTMAYSNNVVFSWQLTNFFLSILAFSWIGQYTSASFNQDHHFLGRNPLGGTIFKTIQG